MKDLQYLLTVLYLQNSLCTIDISIPEYQYLSHRLTPEECRRLYASLHFTTFDLPAALSAAEKNVPDVPCLKLLSKWDKGTKKWEGKDQSHVSVVSRLRQIGRDDLAEWLSKSVFERLVRELDDALDMTFSNRTEKVQIKLKKAKTKNDWTSYDTGMWAVCAGFVISSVIIFGRIIAMCCKRSAIKKKARKEEIMELLSHGSLDSDQETIYECVVKRDVREK